MALGTGWGMGDGELMPLEPGTRLTDSQWYITLTPNGCNPLPPLTFGRDIMQYPIFQYHLPKPELKHDKHSLKMPGDVYRKCEGSTQLFHIPICCSGLLSWQLLKGCSSSQCMQDPFVCRLKYIQCMYVFHRVKSADKLNSGNNILIKKIKKMTTKCQNREGKHTKLQHR